MFTTRRLWTIANLTALAHEYHTNFKEGQDQPFLPRLKLQLGKAPPAVQQLAAEVLWILYLSVSGRALKGATKREQIGEIWMLSGEPVPRGVPAMGPVLEEGVANPYPGFSIHGWREFVFCVETATSWKRLPVRTRAQLLSDPWGFAAWLDGLPDAENRQFRHMLLYMLFPETFERVVALGRKQEIVRTFLPRFGLDPSHALRGRVVELDRALATLRPLLEDRYAGPVVDYYMPPVSADWRGTESPAPRRVRAGPTKVDVASAAYRLWEVLTSLAGEGRRTTVSGLATAAGATAGLVQAALADIAGSCKALGLPPLVIVVDAPEPVLPEFAALTSEEQAAASADVAGYPWDAFGNPYSFAAHGAGYEELLSRLLVEPDSSATVLRLVRHRGRAQQIFRDALLRAYGGRCAVTGSSIRPGLEAAHLVPWNYASAAQRIDVRNGILLTSWHHRLFDARILQLDEEFRIHVDGDAIEVASGVDRAALKALDGTLLRMPAEARHHPDPAFVSLRNALPAPEPWEGDASRSQRHQHLT